MPSYSMIPAAASNADDMTLDIDGSGKMRIKPEYEAMQTNADAEQALEIVELQANATVTPLTHDTLIADTFSDATGFRDTVNAGGTTATFSTNKFVAGTQESPLDEGHGYTFSAGGADTVPYGFEIVPNVNCVLKSVTKDASDGATRAQLKDGNIASPNVIATATFSGAVATFPDTQLQAGHTYFVVVDKSGASFTVRNAGQHSPVIAKTNFNFTAAVWGTNRSTAASAYISSIATISTAAITTGDTVVKIDLPTISGTVSHTQLVLNDPDRETGDSITYSITDGTHTDSGLATDTKNAISTLTANPTSMTMTLTPKSSSPTIGYPSVKSYALKLWKV